jgi:hypothetical protein
MVSITKKAIKRNVLSLPTARPDGDEKPLFIDNRQAIYMVWREGGDMPARVYGPDEASIAKLHAKQMALKYGFRFYVMRAWRAYEPKQGKATNG